MLLVRFAVIIILKIAEMLSAKYLTRLVFTEQYVSRERAKTAFSPWSLLRKLHFEAVSGFMFAIT
ncbi:hypothetical protein AGMMS49546_16430 [Spirochaetia bacterium]|nr:hypothetical protein AGMMS49546_16430 [Spirochaetia bacterium]